MCIAAKGTYQLHVPAPLRPETTGTRMQWLEQPHGWTRAQCMGSVGARMAGTSMQAAQLDDQTSHEPGHRLGEVPLPSVCRPRIQESGKRHHHMVIPIRRRTAWVGHLVRPEVLGMAGGATEAARQGPETAGIQFVL